MPDDIEVFLQTRQMIDCKRMSARITAETCKTYRETNWWNACIGCPRCPKGVTGGSGSDWFNEAVW